MSRIPSIIELVRETRTARTVLQQLTGDVNVFVRRFERVRLTIDVRLNLPSQADLQRMLNDASRTALVLPVHLQNAGPQLAVGGNRGGGGRRPPGGPVVQSSRPDPYDLVGPDPYDLVPRRSRGFDRSPEEQIRRASRAQDLRQLRQAQFRAAINGPAQIFNGSGYNMPGGGVGGGGSRGGGSGGGALSTAATAIMGRLISVDTADRAMRTTVAVGDAGIGQHGSRRLYAQHQAFNNAMGGIPLVSSGADLVSSVANFAKGRGFHSHRALAEHTLSQAKLQDDVGQRMIASRTNARLAESYDPMEQSRIRRHQSVSELRSELTQDQYREAAPGGSGKTRLNAQGKILEQSRMREIDATAARERRDYQRANFVADAHSAIDQQANQTAAKGSWERSHMRHGRQEQLRDAHAAIDTRMAKRYADFADITDPMQKQRAARDLYAEQQKADAEKAEVGSGIRRKFAMEDAAIMSETTQAWARAAGNTYEADQEAFRAAWQAKLAMVQDGTQRQLLLQQETAEKAARIFDYKKETREITKQAKAASAELNGHTYTNSKAKLEDEFFRDATNAGLKYDTRRGTWSGGTPELDERLKSLQQRKASQLGLIERDRGDLVRSYEVNTKAAYQGSRLGGDQFGSQRTKLNHEREMALRKVRDDPKATAAINQYYDTQNQVIDYERKQALRDTRLAGTQSRLRSTGQNQRAEFLETKRRIADEIAGVKNDPALLKETLAKAADELREKSMGNQKAEMFGSMSEYLNSRLLSSANNDGSVYLEQKEAARVLKEAAESTKANSAALEQVAKALAEGWIALN